MKKERMDLPDMGEVTRFYESTPFEVDGIMYYPPQRDTRFTLEFYSHQPMFVLKSDGGGGGDSEYYYHHVRERSQLASV